jgi:hypothetical protein
VRSKSQPHNPRATRNGESHEELHCIAESDHPSNPAQRVRHDADASNSYPHNLIRRKLMQTFLRKSLLVSGIALGAALIGGNASADSAYSLHWQSVIGIVQGNNVVGSGSGAATGAPGPWSALGGYVNVDLDDGEVNFVVRGLVLAGGNSIGTPGTVLQVKGTLVCDADGSASGGNSVLVDAPLVELVELDDQGNARFSGNVGSLPAVCTSEPDVAFLIRTSSGRWIGNGAVLR